MEWVIGIVSGLITGTATCAVFYWLGGRDLKREAGDLRRLNIVTIRALAHAGLAEVNFDEAGKPLGLVFRVHASNGITFTDYANTTAQHNPPASEGISLGGTALAEVVRSDNLKP